MTWLTSLEESFTPHAHPHTTLEADQKKFWYSVQKDDFYGIAEVAEKYPQEYMTWESKEGTPLKTAQKWGCYESFVQLLSMGADKNTDYGGGWTPLLTALRNNDSLFTGYIIENNPNFDAVAQDAKGHSYTALQLAIDNRDTDTVRTLVERGANARLEIETKDGAKVSPADYARSKKQPKIAELLDLAEQVHAIYEGQRASLVMPPEAAQPAPAAQAAPVAPAPAAPAPGK